MVLDKFNMVDMEGIDLIDSQGVEVSGLYQKLVESIALCRYQCLYNWKFNGILIPPTYVEIEVRDGSVWINEGVSVDEEDVVHIHSIEPAPVLPVIELLQITENGVYQAPEGVDGYNPVEVTVDSGFILLDREPTNDDGKQGDYCLSTVQLVPDGIAVRINTVARGTSTNFAYWGTSALRVIFEDSEGTEVNITELQNYVVWLSPATITGNMAQQNQLLTNAVTASYIERNGLPGFIVAKADGLAGHKLKSFSICRRQGSTYIDYIVNFDVYWLKNNAIIGSSIFSVSDLTQNDWPNGELVEFEINSPSPAVTKLYYKNESGWVQIL